MAIGLLINRLPSLVALALFFVYALLMGLTLGVIVLAYVGSAGDVGRGHGVPGRLGHLRRCGRLYGVVTKRDLTKHGRHPLHGPHRALVVMLAQAFLFRTSSLASLGIGFVGVLLFTGLTAFDVQRIRMGQLAGLKPRLGLGGRRPRPLPRLRQPLPFMLLRIFGSTR